MNPPKADLALLEQRDNPDRCQGCGAELQGPRGDLWECVDCRQWGYPCLKCGERGTMPDGDEDDCRSADCLSTKIDAAYERGRDLGWGDAGRGE